MANENVQIEQNMKWWIDAAQYATEALAIILIFRLLWLRERRERIYSVFIGFLALQLGETSSYFLFTRWGRGIIDYRLIWIGLTAALAVLSLWLVYALARAVLAELPGISRFSRNLLSAVFAISILLAFSTARSEYWLGNGGNYRDFVDRLTIVFYVADRAISMASVFVLIAILGFILWFPVKMSRNLAIFSIGFVVYFSSKTALELARTYLGASNRNVDLMSILVSLVLVGCFIYWIIFIDPKGQTTEVRIGHSWRLSEQTKLLDQLESINGALLTSSRHLEL